MNPLTDKLHQVLQDKETATIQVSDAWKAIADCMPQERFDIVKRKIEDFTGKEKLCVYFDASDYNSSCTFCKKK